MTHSWPTIYESSSYFDIGKKKSKTFSFKSTNWTLLRSRLRIINGVSKRRKRWKACIKNETSEVGTWNNSGIFKNMKHVSGILQHLTLQESNIPFWPKKLACFMSVPTLQWPTYLCFISMTASGCNAQII